MAIVGYHISINLLVNTIKTISLNIDNLIFDLVSTAILFTIFFFNTIKNILNFFVQQQKIIPQENERKKAKPIKKNYKKDRKSIAEIFLKMKNLKKEIMLTLEIKMCQTQIEKEKKNI